MAVIIKTKFVVILGIMWFYLSNFTHSTMTQLSYQNINYDPNHLEFIFEKVIDIFGIGLQVSMSLMEIRLRHAEV